MAVPAAKLRECAVLDHRRAKRKHRLRKGRPRRVPRMDGAKTKRIAPLLKCDSDTV